MTKTAAQLDREIAEALTTGTTRAPRLHPVEGIWIPADARRELTRFWRAHPALRRGCLSKYGFDPIDEEQAYWRFGLAEPDHKGVLRAVRQNDGVFSLALAKRWATEELHHKNRQDRHATKKRIPEAVRSAIESNVLAIIEGMYRHHEIHGGKEPCLTVGLITDHLRQARMPEDFRWAIKDRQRTWTRSVLESMRRAGAIGSSFGAKVRCYEPRR